MAISPVTASATSLSQQALRHELENKIVLLRGRYACPISRGTPLQCSLRFTAEGAPSDAIVRGPLDLSAFHIERIELRKNALMLGGFRVLLLNGGIGSHHHVQLLDLSERLIIKIAIDHSQPQLLQKALQTIFVKNLQLELAGESAQQSKAELVTLPVVESQSELRSKQQLDRIGWPPVDVYHKKEQGFVFPKAVYTPDPDLPVDLGAQHVDLTCELMMVVDTEGFPEAIRVISSSDSDLDEYAIADLSQYRFRPALIHHEPVPARMTVEIDFHLN